MPTQAAYDSALATAQLVLVRLLPAFNVSASGASSNVALMIPGPPPLSAGLTTPLPASFTGDERVIDEDELVETGVEALEALRVKLADRAGSPWAHGAQYVHVRECA
jgi:metaxin